MTSKKRTGIEERRASLKKKVPADSFKHLLGLMDLVITDSDFALLSAEILKVRCALKRVKQSYGRLLLRSLSYSMNAADCRELETQSVLLEKRISQLESRVGVCVKSAS